MNNFKKIGLSALAGTLAVVSANATEYAVTGDSQVVWTSQEGNEAGAVGSNGKGIGVDTDLYFNASGELDNGWTMSFFNALNTDGDSNTSSMQATLGMGSLGTIVFADVAGTAANAIDDVLPFAYEETWDGTTHSSQFHQFGGSTTSQAVSYKSPSFSLGEISMSFGLDYDPNAGSTTRVSAGGIDSTTSASGQAGVIAISGMGLTLGAGYEEVENESQTTGATDLTRNTGYIKYANGPVTIGYQQFYNNLANTSASGAQVPDHSGDGMGISFSQDNYSFSYAEVKEGAENISATTANETELSALQASYTMGAMTIGMSMYETTNLEGVASTKYEETELSLSFAF